MKMWYVVINKSTTGSRRSKK